jgi:hypothetical protein
MTLMVKLIKVENEENALICIKVMIDGFRAHKVNLVISARKVLADMIGTSRAFCRAILGLGQVHVRQYQDYGRKGVW